MEYNSLDRDNKKIINDADSQSLKEGTEKTMTTYEGGVVMRTSLKDIHKTLESMCSAKKDAIMDIGFGSLLELKCKKIDRFLCQWLLERFDYNNSVLHVHDKDIPVTIQDVEMVLGLSGTGIDLILKGCKDTTELTRELGLGKGNLKVSNLKAKILNKEDKFDIDTFKKCFTLYMLGTLLCPTTGLEIKSSYLNIVRDVSTIKAMNWSKFILNDLCESIRKRSENKHKGLRGCVFFLKLFYLDRVYAKGMVFQPFISKVGPRIKFWEDDAVKKHARALCPKSGLSSLDESFVRVDDSKTPHDAKVWSLNMENSRSGVEGNISKLTDTVGVAITKLDKLLSIFGTQEGNPADVYPIKKNVSEAVDVPLRQTRMNTCEHVEQKNGEIPTTNYSSRDHLRDSIVREEKVLSTASKTRHSQGLEKTHLLSTEYPSPLRNEVLSSGESFDSLFRGVPSKLGPQPDEKGELKEMRMELKRYKRNKNQQGVNELEFLKIPVALPISSDEDKERLPKTVIKNENGAKNGAPKRKLQFDDIIQPRNISTRGIAVKKPSKYLQTPYVAVPESKKRKQATGKNVVSTEQTNQLRDSIKNKAISSMELKIWHYIRNIKFADFEELVNLGEEHGTREDLKTLAPRQLVNDVVINLFVNMLLLNQDEKDDTHSIWYMPTYFTDKLKQEELDYKNISPYLAKYGGECSSCSKVFITVNEQEKHWYCILIDFTARTLFVLDSLPKNTRRADAKALAKAFDKVCRKKFGKQYIHKASSFVVESPNLPIQNNSYDCGVYVINFLEASDIVKMKDIKFKSNDERLRIATKLLMHPRNTLLFFLENELAK